MVVAADYPFLSIFWTMIIFFAWVVWIWMMVVILGDVFRRRDIGGWAKAGWVIFMVALPFIGVLTYLIAQQEGMAERQARDVEAAKAETDAYIKSVVSDGGAATEIEKGKQLLDSGAITESEFEKLKAHALVAH